MFCLKTIVKLKEECNKKGHNNIKGKILLFIDFFDFLYFM